MRFPKRVKRGIDLSPPNYTTVCSESLQLMFKDHTRVMDFYTMLTVLVNYQSE